MTTKNTIILITMMIMFGLGTAIAQPKGDGDYHARKEKMEAMKVAFITKELDLSPEEAQTFWPVYNEYQDELGKLRKEKHEKFQGYYDKMDELSDKQLNEFVDYKIIYDQRQLDIKKKYLMEFKKVLPIKKVAQLFRAEYHFKKKLFAEMQQRKQQYPHR